MSIYNVYVVQICKEEEDIETDTEHDTTRSLFLGHYLGREMTGLPQILPSPFCPIPEKPLVWVSVLL